MTSYRFGAGNIPQQPRMPARIVQGEPPHTAAGGPPGADVSTNLFWDVLTGINVGDFATFNADKTANKSNRVMLVDELRFEVSGSNGERSPVVVPLTGIPIVADIRLGRFRITSKRIPLPLFCKPKDRTYARATIANTGAGNIVTELGSYVWKLHKPLCLRQNDSLAIEVGYPNPAGIITSRDPATGAAIPYTDNATPYTVAVTGIGRVVDVAPAQRYIPFLSAFVPPFMSTLGADQTNIESIAADLMNPNNWPLMVSELLGQGVLRACVFAGTSPRSATTEPLVDIADTQAAGLSYIGSLIQIVNSGGLEPGADHNFGVRDYLPFAHVFTPGTRAWSYKATLMPKAYLQVREQISNPFAYVDKKASLSNVDHPVGDYVRYAVGMLGYYRVSTEMQQAFGGAL